MICHVIIDRKHLNELMLISLITVIKIEQIMLSKKLETIICSPSCATTMY